jgi:acyl-CoA synthetase (AMP-forming)/AMP-acid ligase II
VAAYRPPFDAGRRANVSLMCVPSFHVGGMLGLLLSLWSGDTTVILPRFDPGRWLELVSTHRVASAFLVPTMLARILDHPALAATDVSSLALVSYGAAAAPGDLVERAMAAWPHAGFANTFGQTETLGAYSTLSPADHHDPQRIGSVGRPAPGVEVRVVAASTGAELAVGETGELWVRSDQNVPAAGDGWLHTGDLARVDADGYIYPAGRISDTINRGGEKFGPTEVMDVLREHPAVAEVSVTGIPDAEMGERVGAAIVLRPSSSAPTLEELRAWCRERLAPFKLPEVVVYVDALPYNELGKLSRRATRDLIEERR